MIENVQRKRRDKPPFPETMALRTRIVNEER
jgi:hypothetical protein